jgi:hypothetical protein
MQEINQFFRTKALNSMRESYAAYNRKEYLESWTLALGPGRFWFACDAIANTGTALVNAGGMIAGGVEALYTWGDQRQTFDTYRRETYRRVNHVFLSSFGALISPGLASRNPNFDSLDLAIKIARRLQPTHFSVHVWRWVWIHFPLPRF